MNPSESSALTSAEQEIVNHVLLGWTNKQIASGRGTSAGTVANQIAAIYQKLGISSRADLLIRLAVSAPEPAPARPPLTCLSSREQQVVLQAIQGHSNKLIAIELALTESTVATHLRRALVKLRLRSRRDLIVELQCAVATQGVP
ncbi:LuxR C-terminal-related transcriptional regulator [Corallococcus sp. bb12-1]|uniref:response regulator transcription factor n=1 Tax=Corallococcus sp. bb12-1 TaxID=2996784 RepID=UPI00226E727C|nr:LuxR C-terminal-related transcriptional regulator [Corallococcus sp. bb12-1]MCY1042101.1 LuxR C-terminal-related transcriptional regulator [Corallococcus sp. bb12-1]